jgi:predicted transcriptional regulator of viral defense system
LSDHIEALKSILRDNRGFITAKQVTNAGIPRRCLAELAKAGEIYRAERGIYAAPSALEDEMYFLQYRAAKGIYSHGSALYLHSMTDRTPHVFTMTFPFGYNVANAKKRGIAAKVALNGLYGIGVTEASSPFGNPLKVYDVEKTLCDIMRGGRNGSDIQYVSQAMKLYAASQTKDLSKLMDYAGRMRVKNKLLSYLEVLL